MYKIDTHYATNRDDIRQAFDACEAHARALIEFYQSLFTYLDVDRDCFINHQLNDSTKERVFQCRELMYGIPVAESFKLNLDDKDIMRCIIDIKAVLSSEMKGLESYIGILQTEPPSRLSALKHWIYLKISKKRHEMVLRYVMVDHQNTKKCCTDVKSLKIHGYKSAMQSNATSDFYADSIAELEAFIDDVGRFYDELVDYSIDDDRCAARSINWNVIIKPLGKQNEIYLKLKAEVLEIQNDDSTERYINYIKTVDDNACIDELQNSIKMVDKILPEKPEARSFNFMDPVIKIFYCAMMNSNNLEKAIPVLNERLEYIRCQKLLDAIDRNIELLKLEAASQRRDLERVEASIIQRIPQSAVVRSVENERLSPEPIEALPDILQPSFEQAVEQSFVTKPVCLAKVHEDNKCKVKDLDAETLAMFFQKPLPHFQMSHKQYYKFMESIGAKVNRSTGNGSAVKIILDPRSVLIAPLDEVVASGMAMHEQHNKGHKQKNLPSYVLKNTIEFFKRAGIHDFLLEQHQINHRPSETSSQACKQHARVLT